ncbi:MAG TPA: 2-amino-4-hydroxy-6-hydroxymethyldihydropteridine diphosphokinase [Patescibacteria group bacterium]|nr:2-amino-4-hydroxy-6-hydroxymethyldihydropteridine diphosphokinase [Patescibacteria group bacterium]
MSMRRALIALGGNLGNVQEAFAYALQQLETIGKIVAKSHIYRTAPVGGPPNQPDYLNAVVALDTDLSAQKLLEFLLKIESDYGRVRHEKWGPRTLDLDLLDYDGQIIDQPNLSVPHPRMWERAFVLVPLNDVAPDYDHLINHETLKDKLKIQNLRGVTKTKLVI